MKDCIQTTLPIYEKDLQSFCDDFLKVKRIHYFRVPDAFWHWLYTNVAGRVRVWFYSLFGGLPDVTVFFPLNDKFSLCVAIELKRRGSYLRANQKQASSALPWCIARTPEEITEIIENAERTAAQLRKLLSEIET